MAEQSAAEGLRTASQGIGRRDEFARVVIAEDRDAVEAVLRKANLKADADLVATGSGKVSRRAQKVIAEDKGLRDLVTQSEWGGQIRKDVERLSPNAHVEDVDLPSGLDAVPSEILVDGVPTRVRFSPTRTRLTGPIAKPSARACPRMRLVTAGSGSGGVPGNL